MGENDLKVIQKAKALAVHTLKVTSNANHYPKKFRFSLVDKMQNKSLIKDNLRNVARMGFHLANEVK